jgi:hypothetical protein
VHPAFKEAAWKLEQYEVSEVIETPTGFQIAKLIDIIPPIEREFEEVIEFARRMALADKTKAVHTEFVREVGPRYNLQKHYERLSDPFINDDDALITVGEDSFTFRDLTNGLPEAYLSHLHAGHFPNIYNFLDGVCVNQLLQLEATRLGLAEREDTAASIEDAVREAKFERALQRRLEPLVSEVSEAELREYFHQNEKRYQTLRTRDIDVLLLKPEGDEPLWQTLKRGEALVERIRAGEDFAELAREYSQHYSAANGGRMENLTNHAIRRIVAPRAWFIALLNDLEEDEVMDAQMAECYDPDRLCYFDTGIVFVRLVKEHPPEQRSFEDVEDLVRSNYLRRNYERFVTAVRAEVLDSMNLQIFYDRLPPI